jgi:sugar phosphate isomerase/epimerase
MKLAFSSNAYLRFSIAETIARIAALGYRGIELLADVPHAWPAGLLEEQKQSIRDALAKHNLTISNINAFMMNAVADPRQPYWHPSWIEPDGHYRAIRREHTKRALQLARDLGAPHITTEPGGPLADGQSWQAGAAVFYEEPEPGLLIERFDQYLEFVSRIDSPMVGLNFDIGHAYCVSEDPQDWVAKMRPHTRHYHFEDIAATRVHQHLVPGRGAINFAATIAAIRQTGYTGWLTVELYPYIDDPDAAAREAKQYLEATLRQGAQS